MLKMNDKSLFISLFIFACMITVIFSQKSTDFLTSSDLDNLTKGLIDLNSINDGINILLINQSTAKLYCHFDGDDTIIRGVCNLLLITKKIDIDFFNGIWCGIGFGKNIMFGADFIILRYFPNSIIRANVTDAYNVETHRFFSQDSYFSNNTSHNNAYLREFLFKEIKVNNFYIQLIWNFNKTISNLDPYDWSDFHTWKTNQAFIYGAWGFHDDNNQILIHHNPMRPRISRIINGFGFNETISDGESYIFIKSIELILTLIICILLL